jgi:hypothetical protein
MAARKRGKLTPEHLEALDNGRKAAAAVRRYLAMIEAPRRRGRQVDWAKRRKAAQAALKATSDPLARLKLTQQVIDAEAALTQTAPDTDEAEADFIYWAAWYSESHGISYSAWRQTGVPASVLRQAGISRTV